MLGELGNIPTNTLIDMVFVILAGDAVLTGSDVIELEQIQLELQRRGEGHPWNLRTVNRTAREIACAWLQ